MAVYDAKNDQEEICEFSEGQHPYTSYEGEDGEEHEEGEEPSQEDEEEEEGATTSPEHRHGNMHITSTNNRYVYILLFYLFICMFLNLYFLPFSKYNIWLLFVEETSPLFPSGNVCPLFCVLYTFLGK